LYSEISGHLSTSTVLVRPNATDVLGKIGVDPESDFVILFDGNRRVLELPSSSLRVASIQNAVIGDGAVFNQTDFHRGKHADGIRIQLTLKFIDATARVNESCADAELMKPLTKHGRLEAQLVRELLGLQLRLIAGSSARSPAREPI
jgi:hypothetical protein